MWLAAIVGVLALAIAGLVAAVIDQSPESAEVGTGNTGTLQPPTSTDTGPSNGPPESQALSTTAEPTPTRRWLCDDPDDDLYAEKVGEMVVPILDERPGWLEVEVVDINRSKDGITIVWELSRPIPDDVGSAPGWGDWLASWSVLFDAPALDYSLLVAVVKEGSSPLRLEATCSDFAANTADVFDVEADGASLSVQGEVLTIVIPLRYLEKVGGEPLVSAGSEYETPQGEVEDGDFFARWAFEDSTCSEGALRQDGDGYWQS